MPPYDKQQHAGIRTFVAEDLRRAEVQACMPRIAYLRLAMYHSIAVPGCLSAAGISETFAIMCLRKP
jgi:hypothetical protein